MVHSALFAPKLIFEIYKACLKNFCYPQKHTSNLICAQAYRTFYTPAKCPRQLPQQDKRNRAGRGKINKEPVEERTFSFKRLNSALIGVVVVGDPSYLFFGLFQFLLLLGQKVVLPHFQQLHHIFRQ